MRIDEKAFNERLEADRKAAEKAAAKEEKPAEKPENAEITIDDFAKVSLKAAKVLSAEPVPKSDKLLRLVVDDGKGERQIVSGIAAWYKPEDLVGKTVVVVANLKPAKLRGVESNGMLLAADTESGANVVFLPDTVKPGASIH